TSFVCLYNVFLVIIYFTFFLLLVFIFYSFFFQSYRDHRDLHSFPTRRSSDLHLFPRNGPKARRRRAGEPRLPPAAAGGSRGSPRSEEHTSELQSRENLVCRLLLEKKKINLKFIMVNKKMCRTYI